MFTNCLCGNRTIYLPSSKLILKNRSLLYVCINGADCAILAHNAARRQLMCLSIFFRSLMNL